jgi:mycoredoxin-dependent peroxiredoxin
MPDRKPPEIGDEAPDFRLKGPGGAWVTLSEYRGERNVVLAFYPLAFSPVCALQLPTLQRDMHRLESLETSVLGISVDSHYANQVFADRLRLTFPLLSDFKREASAAYGVLLGDPGFSGRALFVVDKQGRIAYRDISANPGDIEQVPSNERLITALEAMQ